MKVQYSLKIEDNQLFELSILAKNKQTKVSQEIRLATNIHLNRNKYIIKKYKELERLFIKCIVIKKEDKDSLIIISERAYRDEYFIDETKEYFEEYIKNKTYDTL